MKRWVIFIRERFNPIAYLPTIFVFLGAHFTLASLTGLEVRLVSASTILLAFGVLLFFFMLRLYDEVKDYKLDLQIHPQRPLPRGLVSVPEIKRWLVICAVVELACFGLLGVKPFVGMVIAVSFSVLMYKEFFISSYLRSRLTTYAMMHTAVSILLSLAISSAISSDFIWSLESAAYYFALSSWCLFTIFEFSRKTFSSQEEKINIASYSKVFGRYGAAGLVILMALLSTSLLLLTPFSQTKFFWLLNIYCVLILAVLGSIYAICNRRIFALCYRTVSSLYILVTYSGLIVASLGNKL